jgi:AcrR family transcriptional regulator
MPKVSAEHKDAVRRRILDAALTCLARNDFQDVTTRELVAEAGLSTGTIYNYFSSKELLYEALAEELLGDDIERLQQETGESATGEVLFRFLSSYLFSDPAPAVALSGFRGRINLSGDAKDAIDRLNAFIVQEFTPFVEKARADGFLRDDVDAEAIVELFDIIWDGVGRRAATGTFQTDHTRIGNAMLKLVVHGMLAPEVEVNKADMVVRRIEHPPKR